jgi:hypothetical protein
MTRNITLPIKCSTVKKLDSRLGDIVTWEILITGVAGLLWSITFWMYIHGYRYNVFNQSCPIYVTGEEVILLILAALWIIVAPFVLLHLYSEYLPTFDCIKDEVEE